MDIRPLGFISEKYESGSGRLNSGTIANTKGDPGGKSYGVYQLALNTGTLKRYLDWSKYGKRFADIPIAGEEFDKTWKSLAESEHESFASDQRTYIRYSHYAPASRFAIQQGFDINNRAIQEALFSISVQHGGYKRIIREARYRRKGLSIAQQINSLYDARESYVRGLNTLPDKIKLAIQARYLMERKEVLELAEQWEI